MKLRRPYSFFLLITSIILIQGCIGVIRGEKGDVGTLSQDDLTLSSVLLKRPNYRNDLSNPNLIVVDASETQQSRVVLNGTLYVNRSPVTVNVQASGIGGIDEGKVQPSSLYYLYAVKANEQDSTFALVASLNAPSSGPKTTTVWSYLGAFLTGGNSKVLPSVSTNGWMMVDGDVPVFDQVSKDDEYKILPIPERATNVCGKMVITKINVAGATSLVYTASNAALSPATISYTPLTAADPNAKSRDCLPLFIARTIHMSAGSSSADVEPVLVNPTRFYLLGWQEDATVWR